MGAMRWCEIRLGLRAWERLAEGRLRGTIDMDRSGPLPASVRIRGAHSRRFPKKSLQVDLPAEPLRDEPPVGHTVRRIHLNADYVDPTLLRSSLSFGLFDALGVPAPRCCHTALWVSREYAGTYVALESVDGDFCRRRGWPPGPIYYAVNRNANFGLISWFTRELKASLDAGYKPLRRADKAPLREMVQALNLAGEEEFPGTAERWIDVDGYLRWLVVAVFVANRDGFVHNYALYREPESGRFRIIPWDYDATFGIDINGKPARLDRVPVTGWNRLTHRLLAVPAYRERYRRLFREALDGPLAPDAVAARIDKMLTDAGDWIDMDLRRRGLSTSLPAAVARLKGWVQDRHALLAAELDRL